MSEVLPHVRHGDGGNVLLPKIQRAQPNVTWKHNWPIDEVQSALFQSHFQRLPDEILLNIFRFLSVYELGQIALVCRRFKLVVDQDELWKSKCNTSSKPISKSFKEIYMEWMYEKYLRNAEMNEVETRYRIECAYVACGLRCPPPIYPVRPSTQVQFQPIGGFTVHPNASGDVTIQMSVDLEKISVELISLLKKATKFEKEWREPTVAKQMITRYYRFMQLKASQADHVLLIPTLDIEMVWQTHLLRPSIYRADCLRLFRRVIDHSLITGELEQYLKEQAFRDTCLLYEQRFGEPYCSLPSARSEHDPKRAKYTHPMFGSLTCLIPIYSYWDETHHSLSNKPNAKHHDNPFSFTEADLILDGNWLQLCQKYIAETVVKAPIRRYYSRTNTEIDLGKESLARLIKSYERFLYIAAKYPPKNGYSFVHPTYAIDIMWHSHMQEPLKYAADCDRLVGYLVDHCPWPSVDSNMISQSCDDTKQAWKNEFQVEIDLDHLYNTQSINDP